MSDLGLGLIATYNQLRESVIKLVLSFSIISLGVYLSHVKLEKIHSV